MTMVPGEVISPSLSTTLTRLVTTIASGFDAVLVGPCGYGTSTAANLVISKLEEQAIFSVFMDSRIAIPWQEACRRVGEVADAVKVKTGRCPVLVIDHCGEMEHRDLNDLNQAVTISAPGRFHARLWVGCLDCRSPEVEGSLPIIRDPKNLVLMPEHHRDDLLRIYRAIGRKQECEWGEAILYFLHDWCGSDLSLVQGISTYLYGDWKDRLYDESVGECLDRWLKDDVVVGKYRITLKRMEGTARDYVRLLCSGGKVPWRAAAIEHETDSALRGLFFSGIVTPNLIPGFYQFRNLTVKLLAMCEYVGTEIASTTLLRRSSNARTNVLLQDAEISLRHLLARCFRQMGFDAVKQKLEATKTDELPMTPELRKSLSEWAQQTGGEDLQQGLTKHLIEYTKDFHRTHSLWARVCGHHASEIGGNDGATQDPTVERIVEYLTFSELSNLIQSLCPEVFPNWGKETFGRQPPSKTWPTYLARIRRLRNQSAHLRNVTFQDMEDLLTTTREMRRDIKDHI